MQDYQSQSSVMNIAGLLSALLLFSSCSIVDAQDRADCDKALDVVCSCSSVDCNADDPGSIVKMFRRCDGDEMRAEGYNLHLCVAEQSARYCGILDGLATSSQDLCELNCGGACNLLQACQEFQYAGCDLPETEVGGDK